MARLYPVVVMLVVVIALSSTHPLETQKDISTKNDESQIALPESELSENQRTKRQYYYYPSWAPNTIIRVPPFQNYYYQIKRPYIIPVWGAAGRAPIYLPPQPLYINSGYPSDNPPKKYPGVPYLPPDNPSTDSNGNEITTKPTETKFGDGPVWDHVSGSTSVHPTRRTKRPGMPTVTHPPLVHKDVSTTPTPDTVEKSAVSPIGPVRPVGTGSASKPQDATPPKETPILTNQPSRCVWAIISCCSANSSYISYNCFEQLGCTGAFWGPSPCESEFARSAISAAMNYYTAK